MELAIDVTSPVYPYLQIAAQLREGITSGEYTYVLPSIKKIMEDTGCGYNTARRALGELVKEGIADAIPGRGTFIKR